MNGIVVLNEMAKGLDKTYFMDATSASGPGMIDYLSENNIKYLLIDEIDKLQRKDLSLHFRSRLIVFELTN